MNIAKDGGVEGERLLDPSLHPSAVKYADRGASTFEEFVKVVTEKGMVGDPTNDEGLVAGYQGPEPSFEATTNCHMTKWT